MVWRSQTTCWMAPSGSGGPPLRALIVAPTRELALQVHRELAWLYQYADARVVSCVGGMDPRRGTRELAAGAHIVVGTPGGSAIICGAAVSTSAN